MINIRQVYARLIIVALTSVALVSCTSFRNIEDTMKRVEGDAVQASQFTTAMQKKLPVPQRDTVVFSNEPLVALKPLRVTNKPSESLNCTITFAPATSMDILEFGQIITKLCGIPVRVTSDALAAVNGQFTNTMAESAAPIPTIGQPLPVLPDGSGAGKARMSTSSLGALISNIKWSRKPVEGLLDMVTARLGLSWRYVDGVVSIFYLDTKVFNFYAIPSVTDMQSTVQSGTVTATGNSMDGGISGSSGSNQTTVVSLKTSITDDLAKNVQSILTPNVGRMSMSPSTGTLTVTDTPEILSRVESYLKGENRNITKQVLLNVKVLSVTLTNKDNLGIDWALVYKSLNGNYGIGLKNVLPTDLGATSGSTGILNSGVLDSATGQVSQFANSGLIVKALSQQGSVSTITSPSVTTLNFQPVPVQVARQTSYLARVKTTNTDTGSTTSLEPGTVTTGFNMNLLPYVMPDNNLLLQYSINLSALQQLRPVSSGDNAIEIPEIDNRIFSQKVRLKSGETLILSGFEQSIDNGAKSGVGNPNNILLGGGMNTNNRRDVIVVLITPIVMD